MSGRRAFRRLSNEPGESAVIQDMTPDGHGVATVAGKRVFVSGAIRGESVTFRRTRSRRNYDTAELLAINVASPDRVTPRCTYFGVCGGCTLQHLSSEAQMQMKQTVLIESLDRLGSVRPGRIVPACTGSPWGYRRRARLAARLVDGKGRVLIGFSERDSSRITDMRSCETLHPTVSALLEPLSELIGSLSIARRIPQVEVAVADNATVLVFRILDDPEPDDMAALRSFRDRHGVRVMLQRTGADQMTCLDRDVDGGDLWYQIPGVDVRVAFEARDFIQVNADANRRMIDMALELLAPGPSTTLLDLYCGIGNFTLPLARRAGSVLGVEVDEGMVRRAQHNARANSISNVEFMAADLDAPGAESVWSGRVFDSVLLDPPRAGAAAMMRPIAQTGARRILYISCHPGTLARDAGVLVNEMDYRLTAAGVVDMFPATSHVESVALFERGGDRA